jgi:hypothetical protein
MNFPQAVMLSGYYQVNERWALMANIGRNVTVGATYEFIDLGKEPGSTSRAVRFRALTAPTRPIFLP